MESEGVREGQNDKKKHREIAFAILILMLFNGVFTACGKSGTSSKTEAQKGSIDPNVVYNVINSPEIIASGSISFNSITTAGDRYYVLYSALDDQNQKNLYYMCSFDAEGKNVQNIPIPVEEDAWVAGMGVDLDGGLAIIQNMYNEETQSESNELLYLIIPDDGAEVKDDDAKVNENSTQAAQNGPQVTEKWKHELEVEEFHSSCITSNGQYTVLISDKAVHIYTNEDGKELHTVDLPSEYFYGGICLNEKKEFVLAGAGPKDTTAWRLDPAAGIFTKGEIASDSFYDYSNITNGNGGYDFFLARDDGIYGFVLNGTEPVKVVDFIASDLDIDNIRYSAVISPDSALAVFYEHWGQTPLREY